MEAIANPTVDLVKFEQDKIKGAIRTDFILSAEIIVIALGTMATASIGRQIVALTFVGVAITVLVYGLVAGIVKLDDLGLHLHNRTGTGRVVAVQHGLGRGILRGAPVLMQSLSVLGTAAMFTVGGSIIVHAVPTLERPIATLAARVAADGGWLGTVATTLIQAVAGVVAGAVVAGAVTIARHMRRTS